MTQMGRPPKTERNEQLYQLRMKDHRKYTYKKLGELFNMTKISAREIFLRELKTRRRAEFERKYG